MNYLKLKIFIFLLLLFHQPLFAADNSTDNKVIRLSTSTSLVNSGFLKYLLPIFLKQHPYEIEIASVGSGKALRMGRTGEADVVWVHSPKSEQKFIEEGYGINPQRIMYNDFVLAGPKNDPSNISSAHNVLEALQIIAKHQQLFISRGDDSGTHKKELSLWKYSGVNPYGTDWYLETGGSMSSSLEQAQKNNAYIMIDRATFLVLHKKGFKILFEDSSYLSNPYSLIAVAPNNNKLVNLKGANAFINWIISQEGQQAITNFKHDNVQLFHPIKYFNK